MNVLLNKKNYYMSSTKCTEQLEEIERLITQIKQEISLTSQLNPRLTQSLSEKYELFKTCFQNLSSQSCTFVCQNPNGTLAIAIENETNMKQKLNNLLNLTK